MKTPGHKGLWLKLIFLGVTIYVSFFCPCVSAFVLLSGPAKARLDVSVDNPEVTFYWNRTTPSLSKVDEFADGGFADENEEALMEQIILAAMAPWNEVPGSFVRLKLEIDDSVNIDAKDQKHVITVKKDSNVTSAAFAIPTVKEKVITDCDIVLGHRRTSARSLAYTIMHELGHCLGLGHLHTNYNAVMGYARSSDSLKLGADDKAGLIYLYQDPDFDQGGQAACGTLFPGVSSPQTRFWGWGLCLLPLIFIWAPLRRGRAKKE